MQLWDILSCKHYRLFSKISFLGFRNVISFESCRNTRSRLLKTDKQTILGSVMDYGFCKINVCKYPIGLKDKHFQGFQRKLDFYFVWQAIYSLYRPIQLLVDFIIRKEEIRSNANYLSFRSLIPKCMRCWGWKFFITKCKWYVEITNYAQVST